jgi:hypothetical protein
MKDTCSTDDKKEPIIIDVGSKALMITMPDSSCYLTQSENLSCLIEFARTFKAEISVIELKEKCEIHSLDSLIQTICSGDKHHMTPEHTIIEIKIKGDLQSVKKRSHREQTAEIHKVARQIVETQKKISIADLKEKFPNIDKTILNNCLTRAIQKLQVEGVQIIKIKPGIFTVGEKVFTVEKVS